MTTAVSLPSITETYKRALLEVIKPYFDGNQHEVNCTLTPFPDVEIVFDERRLAAPRPKAVICIAGFTERNYNKQKSCAPLPGDCDPAEWRPTYEFRSQTNCIVTVAHALEEEDPAKSKREMDRIYGLLSAIICAETVALASRNIFFAHLGSLATEDSHQEYAIVRGRLQSEIRYTSVTVSP